MEPLAQTPVSTPSPGASTSTGVGTPTPSQSSQQAFQMALSAALNPPNVLGSAGGDDDDDDGSSLTVKNSMGV